MESFILTALKDVAPPLAVVLFGMYYLFNLNKSREKEVAEIKELLLSLERKLDNEIAELKEKYHEIDKRILKQQQQYVDRVDFIALINDTNRRFEVMHQTLIDRDEKFRSEIKELFHIAIKGVKDG